ncbi:hypothetical protein RUND412_009639 [Rhizina undulata]
MSKFLNLFNRRPCHSPNGSITSGFSEIKLSISSADLQIKLGNGIPESLSFDRIIAGATCSPVTTRDFMQYLLYVGHAAENLQFYLWLTDYERRFAKLADKEKTLSPEWNRKNSIKAPAFPAPTHYGGGHGIKPSRAVISFFANTFKENKSGRESPGSDSFQLKPYSGKAFDLFETPPETPQYGGSDCGGVAPFLNGNDSSLKFIDHKEVSAEAFKAVDLKWEPFTIQPFREEISRIIATYISTGSPRELNVSSRERIAVLHALENTTHPSALEVLKRPVEEVLRTQAHPAFIQWSICNGNRARVLFARALGVSMILIGFLVAVLLTLSGGNRGLRALGAIGWFFGTSTLLAALKGLCIVLHGAHHQNIRPWELWNDNESGKGSGDRFSFDAFGPKNSYEDEPWVAKYENRFFLRKIFDREMYIEEPALREVQNAIAVKSIVTATVCAAALSAIFIMVPGANLF